MAYNSTHTGAEIDATITEFKDETMQASATDTTAGRIPKMGNDADFGVLSGVAPVKCKRFSGSDQYVELSSNSSLNRIIGVSAPGNSKPFIVSPDTNSSNLQLRTASVNPILLMPNDTEAARIDNTVMTLEVPIKAPSYTVGTVPSAATVGAGGFIYVTDGDAGSPCVAVSNGTDWKVVALGATISAT